MTLPAAIVDPRSKRSAGVTPDFGVSVHPLQWPQDTLEPRTPFGGFLTDDGTDGGSSDMLVDGSTNPVDFYVTAPDKKWRYISAINIEISDTGIALNLFGSLAALGTGVQFFYERLGGSFVGIQTAMQTNLDMIRAAKLTGDVGGWGDGTSAFLAQVQGAGNPDGYIPTFFLDKLMPPYGIQLDGTKGDRLGIRINDDLTAMIGTGIFNARVVGFDLERNES